MSRGESTIERFSCDTSRFLLPTFRRPNYSALKRENVDDQPEDEIFFQWTKEVGKYYSIINSALLNDDYDVLKQNVHFINNLRHAIRNNNHKDSINVYRGLNLPCEHVKRQYTPGIQFLWPTFTSTSKNRDVAHGFGSYMFEIEATDNDWTYRADISQYSKYRSEEEVLFYPYSGFVVKDIIPDAKIIQLKCVDTRSIEKTSREDIPEEVKIFDESRNIYVYFYKGSPDIFWSRGDEPDQIYRIGQNSQGYWDAPYRYHHRNGYFVDKGDDIWEEYQNNKHHSTFQRIFPDENTDECCSPDCESCDQRPLPCETDYD